MFGLSGNQEVMRTELLSDVSRIWGKGCDEADASKGKCFPLRERRHSVNEGLSEHFYGKRKSTSTVNAVCEEVGTIQ